MKILSKNGDDEVRWSDGPTLAAAQAQFEALTSRGFHGFKEEGDGSHSRIGHFDPDADIIMVPQLIGG
jgi:hypothetical protein